MPIPEFNQLSDQEIESLINAPAYVTILIASADDKIDKKEKNWAKKLVNYRSFTSEEMLNTYYEEVNKSFEMALESLEELYNESENGLQAVSQELEKLNPILKKLDDSTAATLLSSWRSLAQKVAEASGGFLGMFSTDNEEKKWIDLPMLES
ncbi:MAG: hypothetical protein AAF824_00400 [Bacteroidota bacterium]